MRILLLLLAIAFPLSAEDWPQFLGPRRDGSYQGKALPAWPAAGPQQLWQTSVGAGFAGPAVADGKLIRHAHTAMDLHSLLSNCFSRLCNYDLHCVQRS